VKALTLGEVHDVKGYKILMDEDVPPPKVILADRGYDADAIRGDLSERGTTPIFPTKRNRRVQIEIDRAVCALRNRIERCFNRLKNFAPLRNTLRQAGGDIRRLCEPRLRPSLATSLCQHSLVCHLRIP